ncbi:MAG: class I SAM-dependent methyltransferase family protein [Candidatus Bathyarchaeota archaeon]|jgi:tRNA (guanine37-N1)-methyltransferase|nr:class I SAM-dependent methyltransferase family protein [Candidatus Bathyarchaeota archaeon A05DMB-5]MDH7557440.1 class I SAM-dependent methyltransferase family protein [Candidatus Bathyarchaeota archaeon]
MSKQALCIKVPKVHGEEAVVFSNKLKIVDKQLEIQRTTEFVYIPLARDLLKDELKMLQEKIPTIEIQTYKFPERKKRVVSFFELLQGKLPPHLLANLPRAIDFVGDIAIAEIPPELAEYKGVIGEAILKAHKNVRTVLAKVGAVSGTYRLREFVVIAGEPKTETIHKEHGCQFRVDLTKAYFSPRLSYEHKRVASLVMEGETVVDLFTGVGPFAILIAKTHGKVKVYAVDVNPYAVEFLRENVRLNRLISKVYPLLGDARQVVEEKLARLADRVIMNLPEKAIEYVDAACKTLKPEGGVIHFYSFINASNSLENMKLHFAEAVQKCGRKVEKIFFARFVRETAPYEWQAVIDAKIH